MKKILGQVIVLLSLLLPSAAFAQANPTPTATLPVIVTGVQVYDTSATIEGVMASFLVTPTMVTYGTDRTIFPGQVFLIAGPDGHFRASLRNLLPNTRYYYQVATVDPVLGRKSVTSVANFMTKSPLADFSIQKVTAVGATISGKVSSLGMGGGIWVGPSSDLIGKVYPISAKSDGTFTIKVTGLTPETSYDTFLQTSGGVQLSGIRAFTTISIVVNPYIGQVDSTSATISVPDLAGIKGLSIHYGQATDALNNDASMTLADGVYSAKLSGLKADTQYYYTVRITGSDPSETKKETEVYSFVTAQGASKIEKAPTSNTPAPVPTKTFVGKLVPCSGVDVSEDGKTTTQTCTFGDVMKLFTNIIDFLLFLIAPIIATSLLLYGGVLILFSGGSTEQVSKAKGIFSKALVGLLLAMGAWLIIKFVMQQLGYNDTIFPTFY